MPAERVAMRQVREILRLSFVGPRSGSEIARRLGLAASTVRETLQRVSRGGADLAAAGRCDGRGAGDEALQSAGTKQGHRRHAEPDWAGIHRELKRKHVTLSILWDEYIERTSRRVSLFPFLRSLSRL